jgi:hypothetical protein
VFVWEWVAVLLAEPEAELEGLPVFVPVEDFVGVKEAVTLGEVVGLQTLKSSWLSVVSTFVEFASSTTKSTPSNFVMNAFTSVVTCVSSAWMPVTAACCPSNTALRSLDSSKAMTVSSAMVALLILDSSVSRRVWVSTRISLIRAARSSTPAVRAFVIVATL